MCDWGTCVKCSYSVQMLRNWSVRNWRRSWSCMEWLPESLSSLSSSLWLWTRESNCVSVCYKQSRVHSGSLVHLVYEHFDDAHSHKCLYNESILSSSLHPLSSQMLSVSLHSASDTTPYTTPRSHNSLQVPLHLSDHPTDQQKEETEEYSQEHPAQLPLWILHSYEDHLSTVHPQHHLQLYRNNLNTHLHHDSLFPSLCKEFHLDSTTEQHNILLEFAWCHSINIQIPYRNEVDH